MDAILQYFRHYRIQDTYVCCFTVWALGNPPTAYISSFYLPSEVSNKALSIPTGSAVAPPHLGFSHLCFKLALTRCSCGTLCLTAGQELWEERARPHLIGMGSLSTQPCFWTMLNCTCAPCFPSPLPQPYALPQNLPRCWCLAWTSPAHGLSWPRLAGFVGAPWHYSQWGGKGRRGEGRAGAHWLIGMV